DQVLFSDDGPPGSTPNRLPETAEHRLPELLRETVDLWETGRLADAPDRIALLNDLLSDPGQSDIPELRAVRSHLRQVEASIPSPRRAPAMADGTGWDECVYIRGSHKNLGELVPRRFLEVLAGPVQPAPTQGSGRLELARRVVDPSNPLP